MQLNKSSSQSPPASSRVTRLPRGQPSKLTSVHIVIVQRHDTLGSNAQVIQGSQDQHHEQCSETDLESVQLFTTSASTFILQSEPCISTARPHALYFIQRKMGSSCMSPEGKGIWAVLLQAILQAIE